MTRKLVDVAQDVIIREDDWRPTTNGILGSSHLTKVKTKWSNSAIDLVPARFSCDDHS